MTDNLPALQLPAMPQHLAVFQGKPSIASAIKGGITLGASFHSIGIKASRFRLNDPQGGEVVVPHHHLDVIIVDANPTQSKVWYEKAYDPSATPAGPDCYSDNGVGASSRAPKPQSTSCAACPHNVWGSKITPSGKQIKACADVKKLAVLLAENPHGAVYALNVPPASLKNLYSFIDQLDSRGVPPSAMVIRLTFNIAADYPQILFGAHSWADESQVEAVLEVQNSSEADPITNKTDKPVALIANTPAPALAPAPAPQPQQAQQATPIPPVQPAAPVAEKAPRKPRTPKQPEVQTPQPAAQPEVIYAAQEVQAPAPQAANGFFANLAQKRGDAPHAQAPAAAVNVAPTPSSQALDDLIAGAMQV